MARNKSAGVTSLTSFLTFVRHFWHYCFALRALLGVQFALVLLAGIVFAWCEGLSIGQGLYFSLITATTVGYGDITPQTGIGHFISLLIACGGLIVFGFVVATSNKAFTVTIEQYLHDKTKPSSQDQKTESHAIHEA